MSGRDALSVHLPLVVMGPKISPNRYPKPAAEIQWRRHLLFAFPLWSHVSLNLRAASPPRIQIQIELNIG